MVRFRGPRELRIPNLIEVLTEGGLAWDTHKQIRNSCELAILERRLIDHTVTRLHCCAGRLKSAIILQIKNIA